MKIAIICEYFPKSSDMEVRGGVEARTYYVGRHLAKKHELTVYSALEEGMDKESEFDGIRVVRVKPEIIYSQKSSLAKRLAFMRNAAKEVRTYGADLVDGASVLGYPPAWWSGCGVRTITYHDVWCGKWVHNIGVSGVFGELMERYTLTRDWDQIIAVSKYTRDNLIRFGVNDEKVTVAENGIDLGEIEGVDAEKFEHPTICAVSRLVSYKRIEDLIDAAHMLKKDVKDLRVKIVGTGPMMQTLKSRAARLGVGDVVEFVGHVEKHSEVLRIMKSSHVFCQPSVVEGFGISVVEAMALKTPYVASDIPAMREATSGGVGGILYTPKDTAELAESLKKALEGGVIGGSDEIGDYDWKVRAKKVEDAYEQLINKHARQ